MDSAGIYAKCRNDPRLISSICVRKPERSSKCVCVFTVVILDPGRVTKEMITFFGLDISRIWFSAARP